MGIGSASGENRATEAARAAISSPLLETSMSGATGVLLNITGGPDLGLFEIDEAASIIRGAADEDCNVIFGAVIDENAGDTLRVTVIATGFDGPHESDLDVPASTTVARKRPAAGTPAPSKRSDEVGRQAVLGAAEKADLEISDDVLEIPDFLK
jgi:cell division protein FtsZ